MPTKAIRDVELVTTGTWAASTGRVAVTRTELEAMLAAGKDQLLDRAPVKFGHSSALNDPIGDGEPAYGWVIPTRVGPSTSQPGETSLFGDLVGIPARLAEAIPTAYRRRSVEVAYAVKTTAGKLYSAVITAVALLGVTKPAVKGLADVVALYGAGAEIDHRDRLEIVDGLEASPQAVAMLAAAAAAGATVEIVDAIAAAAGARDTASIPPPVDETVNDDPQKPLPGGSPMAGTVVTEARIRELLGQEQNADVEATIAALRTPAAGDPATPAAPAAAVPDAPAATATPATPADPAATPAEPVVATVAASEGTATLSADTLSELQRDAAWARDQRRAQLLDGAIAAGKITPAERAHFAAAVERDEAGTTALIGGLAARFPVGAGRGSDTAPLAELSEGPADAEWDGFMSRTFGIDPAPAQ